jgi:hypothetical protein
MNEETKIVITIKGESVRIGVQQTSCDPILFHPVPLKAEDDLRSVLGTAINETLQEARIRWQANPRYPQAEVPTTQPVTPAAASSHAVSSTPAKSPQNNPQTAMF